MSVLVNTNIVRPCITRTQLVYAEWEGGEDGGGGKSDAMSGPKHNTPNPQSVQAARAHPTSQMDYEEKTNLLGIVLLYNVQMMLSGLVDHLHRK